MEEGSDVSYQQMRSMIERFEQWGESSENFEQTPFTREELALRLRAFLLSHTLDAQSFDLLMAISCAIEGRHHAFQLIIKRRPANGSFQAVNRHELWRSSSKMANEIDIAVANGDKQESVVEDASTRYDLSRAEVYRRLSQVRTDRALSYKAHLHVEAEKSAEGRTTRPLSGPEGYIITEDGKFRRVSA